MANRLVDFHQSLFGTFSQNTCSNTYPKFRSKTAIMFEKELFSACIYVLLHHLIALALNLTLRFKLSNLSIKHFLYLHQVFQAQDLF